MLSIQTPFTDRLSAVAAGMRVDPSMLAAAKVQAIASGKSPGAFVRLRDTDSLGLVVRFHEAAMSVFPAHEYPLVVLTSIGEMEMPLDEVSPSGLVEVIARLYDDTEVRVRPVQTGDTWALATADGRFVPPRSVEDLLPTH